MRLTSTFGRILRVALLGALGVAVVPATPALAQRRARLSDDLSRRVAAGDAQIDVIVHGSRADVEALAGRHAVRVKRFLRSGAVLDVTAGQLAAIREDAPVDHLSSDAVVRSSVDWAREAIGADQLWAGLGAFPRPLSGRGTVVAVIDSGVDVMHSALRGRVLASVDFTGGDGSDGYGHGTHVASLIAGAAGAAAETADYAGVAPGARIVSLRVLDDHGAGRASDVIEAIDWVVENQHRYGIRVINLSLGGPVTQSYEDDPLCEAAERAIAAGITVVAAAGNFGQTPDGKQIFGGITTPAIHPGVIAVGALDTRGTAVRSDDRIAKFSSRGPTMYDQLIKPDLVAPGRNIIGAEAAGSVIAAESPERHVTGSGRTGYIQLSGSSMSAGVVSGAVALMLDRRPGLRPGDIRTVLQLTSSYMPDEGLVATGAGSLNALAAVNFLDRRTPAGAATTIAGEAVLASGLAIDASRRAAARFDAIADVQSGTVLGSKVVWGTALQGDTIVWGGASTFDTIVWGNATDTIVWGGGTPDTIVWGGNGDDTIVWGGTHLDTIVWGLGATGKVVWGTRGNDHFVWTSRSDDTIVWGGHTADTIVWGGNSPDTIIWGHKSGETIVWGGGTSDTIVWGGSSGDTIVWGGGTPLDTIVWGGSTNETIVWGGAESSDTIVWGGSDADTIIWGGGTPDTIVWGL